MKNKRTWKQSRQEEYCVHGMALGKDVCSQNTSVLIVKLGKQDGPEHERSRM